MSELTVEQRSNLEKLAAYLEGLAEDYDRFSMSHFLDHPTNPFPERATLVPAYARNNGGIPGCGTVACACGHGPAAGVLVASHNIGTCSVDWWSYAAEAFGAYELDTVYEWLFSVDWAATDDTARGAAARIRYLLANDAPDEWGYNAGAVALYAPYRIDAPQPALSKARDSRHDQ